MPGRTKRGNPPRSSQSLQRALRLGLTIVSELWSFPTGDWVTSVHAADIDGDGDIEIILGVRNGNIYVLTRGAIQKWKLRLSTEWVRTLRGINNAEAADKTRIVIGSRDGRVQAFDENGKVCWDYKAGHVVRHVRVYDLNQNGKTFVLAASEDQSIHALSSESGDLVWKYNAGGWIQTVHAADIDGDGEMEVLAGSVDKHLYILDSQGRERWRHDLKNEVQYIVAEDIDRDGKTELLVATDAKDLRALTPDGQEKWRFPCDSRILSLTLADLNRDGRCEVIAASEGKYVYFLDSRGKFLWKHNLGGRIFSVHAQDIDNDGQIEVLAGTENSVHVLHIELMDGLREKIITTHKRLGEPPSTKLDLSSMELSLFYTFIKEPSPEEPLYRLEDAFNAMHAEDYLEALSTLVGLSQQKVQLLWRNNIGRVRAVFSGDLLGDPQLEVVAGTDDGGIYVLNAAGQKIWSYLLKDNRIWTVFVGDIDLDGALEVVAGSNSGWLYVFSNTGETKWERQMKDRVESVYINEEPQAGYAEMVIGLRGGQENIQIFNHHFEPVIKPIRTPHGVRVVATYDLDGDGMAEIIAGGDDDYVYAYRRDGSLLWSYRTGDRARGLVLKDLDHDGQMEIVVGSEDRNVHVLSNRGHLKWRYSTPHQVLSVNTLDLDLDGEIEVFLGTDDGNVLFLSKTGDLLWKYKVGDRVRGVQAADCNLDGKMEIIVGSEDGMLYLLQVLDQQEVLNAMEQCWRALRQQGGSEHLVYDLATHRSSSLRAFALTRIATQGILNEKDSAVLKKLIRDNAEEVRIVFAQEIPRLYRANPALSRGYMDILLGDRERDVKLALVETLPDIARLDENVAFQYLERFIKSIDAWVRRAIVRKLDQLTALAPERVFRLLLALTNDENEWVRQEAARALAHYFDLREKFLLSEARALITRKTDLALLKLIAYSSTRESVCSFFLVSVDLQETLAEGNALERLDQAVCAFEKTKELQYGQEVWQTYHELQHLHRMRTIEEIAYYKCIVCSASLSDVAYFDEIADILYRLTGVSGILAKYLKREGLGDRLASLLEATAAIEGIATRLKAEESQTREQNMVFPERLLIETLLTRWRTIIIGELSRLRGKADLRPVLRTKTTWSEEQIAILLDIRNEGRSPADNVRVTLKKNGDFDIIGQNMLELETVSASDTVVAEFTIRPRTSRPHLTFDLVYADAESREKTYTFADRLEIRKTERTFQRIPNPYSIGTPIQTRDMFYGREEDLAMLRDDLTSVSVNMVVVLYGQRRSGKSSLLYQLLNTSSLDPHIPVYIDMQHETLNMNTARFLHRLAQAIHHNLNIRGVQIDQPGIEDFQQDATLAFDLFLDQVEIARRQRKLIIMIDEFEVLEQKVKEKVLAGEIFEYLRSLMQHRRGINFLLSGTHTIEQLTMEYWSVFFNIARHQRLSRLSAEAARQLITQPIAGYLEYDPLAVEKIRQLAADQPYLIQLICRSLVSYCNEAQKSYVTINDVNTVQDRVMETGQVHFTWLWGQTSLEGRLVLSILAQEGGEEGRALSLKEIEKVYLNFKLPYDHQLILDALGNLVAGDIVKRVSEGTCFKVSIGLTRRWLRDNKPLKRVLLEENLLI
jgi:outer membrane protein assembly factor BamB